MREWRTDKQRRSDVAQEFGIRFEAWLVAALVPGGHCRGALKIVETRASLVALVSANSAQNFKKLAGVSVDANVSCGKHSFRENILFTHRGLSGPAILQISNYWRKDQTISIDLSLLAKGMYYIKTRTTANNIYKK